MLRRWQRMLRAEDATIPQRISSCVHAATRYAAPCVTLRSPSAAHVSCRMRAAELLPVSQRRGICVRRPAEDAAARSMLGDARALDARELVWLVVLTERAAAPERRCVVAGARSVRGSSSSRRIIHAFTRRLRRLHALRSSAENPSSRGRAARAATASGVCESSCSSTVLSAGSSFDSRSRLSRWPRFRFDAAGIGPASTQARCLR